LVLPEIGVFRHIIPLGPDHILFVVSLCLLSNRIKTIIWQASAFTLAHTLTLALSMKNIIVVPPAVVDTIIALSICFCSIGNMLITELKAWRVLIVFMFGLIHGMGFASALNEIGLPRNQFYTSILSFNAGVELGQVAVITAMFVLIISWWGKKPWYRKFIVYPLSAIIALIAAWWTVGRVFFEMIFRQSIILFNERLLNLPVFLSISNAFFSSLPIKAVYRHIGEHDSGELTETCICFFRKKN